MFCLTAYWPYLRRAIAVLLKIYYITHIVRNCITCIVIKPEVWNDSLVNPSRTLSILAFRMWRLCFCCFHPLFADPFIFPYVFFFWLIWFFGRTTQQFYNVWVLFFWFHFYSFTLFNSSIWLWQYKVSIVFIYKVYIGFI